MKTIKIVTRATQNVAYPLD